MRTANRLQRETVASLAVKKPAGMLAAGRMQVVMSSRLATTTFGAFGKPAGQ